jgi:hypothetical protein
MEAWQHRESDESVQVFNMLECHNNMVPLLESLTYNKLTTPGWIFFLLFPVSYLLVFSWAQIHSVSSNLNTEQNVLCSMMAVTNLQVSN